MLLLRGMSHILNYVVLKAKDLKAKDLMRKFNFSPTSIVGDTCCLSKGSPSRALGRFYIFAILVFITGVFISFAII